MLLLDGLQELEGGGQAGIGPVGDLRAEANGAISTATLVVVVSSKTKETKSKMDEDGDEKERKLIQGKGLLWKKGRWDGIMDIRLKSFLCFLFLLPGGMACQPLLGRKYQHRAMPSGP